MSKDKGKDTKRQLTMDEVDKLLSTAMAARAGDRSNSWLEQVCILRGRETWRDRNDQDWPIAQGADSAHAQKNEDLSGYQDRSEAMRDQSWQDNLIKSASGSPKPCLANVITAPFKTTDRLSVRSERRGSHSEETE